MDRVTATGSSPLLTRVNCLVPDTCRMAARHKSPAPGCILALATTARSSFEFQAKVKGLNSKIDWKLPQLLRGSG